MLRLHGNRLSLLAALTAHWAQNQLDLTSLQAPEGRNGLRRTGEGSIAWRSTNPGPPVTP